MQDALHTFAAATGNDLYDPEWNGGSWLVAATETRETIDDFIDAALSYHRSTHPQQGEIGGFPFVAFSEVQVRKGDPRRSLSVVDLGEIRIALDVDLAEYL